jgi:hypothetical protein
VEMVWFLAYLAQFGALVAGMAMVVALVAATVYELVRNRVRLDRVSGFASMQKAVTGSAS